MDFTCKKTPAYSAYKGAIHAQVNLNAPNAIKATTTLMTMSV
jgi:hypothetical protein